MATFLELLRNLKNKLLGKELKEPDTKTFKNVSKKSSKDIHPNKRKPYFIQIGLDFGTSYSKCIYRDMMTQKAWVHIPAKFAHLELPFLIPSVLILENGKINAFLSHGEQYPENGLYHPKSALVKMALGQYDNSILNSYRKLFGSIENADLFKIVESCAVYLLAGILGEVKSNVKKQFKGFGSDEQDYMAVNLAVPIGEVEHNEVNKLFHRVLTDAWSLADALVCHPTIDLNELESLRVDQKLNRNELLEESCFIYPEVSANVQGFVRSRLSGEGIYLFSDTGASTIDQSIFIFRRPDKTETLTYLCGRVLPLGSGQIELLAAEATGQTNRIQLEDLRKKKEQGNNCGELLNARKRIEHELIKETEKTLAIAKMKLHVRDELNRIRIIFGGGGHCEIPYKRAVIAPFSGQLFREPVNPDIISVPPPPDLELQDYQKRWMRRLSVAYGLSFEKSELARFIYPKDVAEPMPEEIWKPQRIVSEAPSKDQC